MHPVSDSDQGAVIVTGASRGIGAAAARRLIQLGAPVVLGGRSDEALGAIVQELTGAGGEAIAVPGDICLPAVRTRLVEAARDGFGGVQALANNAAILGPLALLADADADRWRAVWETNVLAPVLLTAEALPWLRQSRGRVINVSSGAAERAVVAWGAYDLSKAALTHFTRQLAAEEPLVTAVALRPGRVDTAMQAEIRAFGQASMVPEYHATFVRAFEEDTLIKPEQAGNVLAGLCLFAPASLSGEFISWDDPRVQPLGAE